MNETGQALRRDRLAKNISLRRLAKQAGVSPETVRRFERGCDYRISTYEKLRAALGTQCPDTLPRCIDA